MSDVNMGDGYGTSEDDDDVTLYVTDANDTVIALRHVGWMNPKTRQTWSGSFAPKEGDVKLYTLHYDDRRQESPNNHRRKPMTREEADIEFAQAETEKAKAHARLLNAQAEQLENDNKQKASDS